MLVSFPICEFSGVKATKGKLYTWGQSLTGQLGNGTNTPDISSPVAVGALTTWTFVTNGGESFMMALKSDNTGWSWGDNNSGALGDNSTTERDSPVQIAGSHSFTVLNSGNLSGGAIDTLGKFWTWGRANQGNLGNGTTSGDISSPVQIGALTTWTKIARVCSSNTNSRGGIAGGALYTWGINSSGQLGQGNTTTLSSPVQVGVATNWTDVSFGSNQMIALNSSGQLWAAGTNGNGQLGDNSTTGRSSPVQVAGAQTWVSFSVGNAHTLAIDSLGKLWAWGLGTNGRLGINSTSTVSSPVQVGTATNWLLCSAGLAHSAAINSAGKIFVWGAAANGALGNGTTTPDISSPVQLGSASDWLTVACGNQSTGAVKVT